MHWWKNTYQPHPKTSPYTFSNGFDVIGTKGFGFEVCWIRRLPPAQIAADIQADPAVGPGTMYKILRLQSEQLGNSDDREVGS